MLYILYGNVWEFMGDYGKVWEGFTPRLSYSLILSHTLSYFLIFSQYIFPCFPRAAFRNFIIFSLTPPSFKNRFHCPFIWRCNSNCA